MPIDIFDIGFQTAKEIPEERKQRLKDAKDIQKLADKFISDRTERSFSLLMKRCNWGLRAFIYGMVGNDYDTDNVMSTTMEHVWFGIDTFKSEIGKFSTWLYTIAYNDTVRYLKNNGLREKLNIVPMDISDIYGDVCDDDDETSQGFDFGPVETIADNMYFNGKELVPITRSSVKSDIYDASVECLGYLPDHLRIVMTERFVNRKKVDQIAEDNNIPKTSVNNWIIKGRQCLFNEVKNRHPELYDIYNETIHD